VPFDRPAAVSGDDASLIDVLRHALSECEAAGDSVDVICSLQPTAPFLLAETMNTCLSRFRQGMWDSAVTVRRVLHNHPYRAYDRDGDGLLRPLFPEGERLLQRQDLPPLFALSGGFYARRAALVRNWSGRDFALGSRCLGVTVSEIESMNIDTPMDLELARLLAGRQVTA
jgi:CMP-N-acetylneuraminic acid synthetase